MDVQLRLMPLDRVADFLSASHADYLQARMRAGESEERATRAAEESMREHFPDGRPLPTHRFFDVLADDTAVGTIWIGPRKDEPGAWWVYDIAIKPEFRRRGHARRALELAHAEAKALGGRTIGLQVFADNPGAHALYESLGYADSATQMLRTL